MFKALSKGERLRRKRLNHYRANCKSDLLLFKKGAKAYMGLRKWVAHIAAHHSRRYGEYGHPRDKLKLELLGKFDAVLADFKELYDVLLDGAEEGVKAKVVPPIPDTLVPPKFRDKKEPAPSLRVVPVETEEDYSNEIDGYENRRAAGGTDG